MSDSRRLFAYGSLTEGMVHFDKVSGAVASRDLGTVTGAVYRLQVGFPVVLLDGADQIPGQLLGLQDSDALWRILDEFHGFNPILPEKSLYVRNLVSVQTSAGMEEAYIYTLNPKKLPRTAVPIEGGDWLTQLRNEPPLTQRLTERQVSYIKRLGASTGREIVPIDMQLYRELMGLEIIVDKGRRLALSGFGQEVYRFLR